MFPLLVNTVPGYNTCEFIKYPDIRAFIGINLQVGIQASKSFRNWKELVQHCVTMREHIFPMCFFTIIKLLLYRYKRVQVTNTKVY